MRLAALSIDQQAGSDAAALVHLQGVAQTDAQISQFAQRLAKSAWFGAVQLLPGSAKAPGTPRQFEITAIFETQSR